MRVPVCESHMGTYYEVYVGDDQYIRYQADDLPDCVKIKLAMVKASPQPELSMPITPLAFHKDQILEGMENIGWKSDERVYCLIFSRKELSEFSGERRKIDRSTYGWTDPRGVYR